MIVELSKEEIIAEIDKNYRNDTEMYVEIIDGTTNEYGCITETVKKLIELLKDADAISLDELVDFYKGEEA
jgi:hypothetical protein